MITTIGALFFLIPLLYYTHMAPRRKSSKKSSKRSRKRSRSKSKCVGRSARSLQASLSARGLRSTDQHGKRLPHAQLCRKVAQADRQKSSRRTRRRSRSASPSRRPRRRSRSASPRRPRRRSRPAARNAADEVAEEEEAMDEAGVPHSARRGLKAMALATGVSGAVAAAAFGMAVRKVQKEKGMTTKDAIKEVASNLSPTKLPGLLKNIPGGVKGGLGKIGGLFKKQKAVDPAVKTEE